MQWRFLVSGMWWQAHPYSLSAMPTANRIRITVKALGDHSDSLARLEPGTPVAIEGPYGTFTKHVRKSDRVLLVGAGVGATPIRALLDDLPRHVDMTVILRGRQADELVLRDEIAQLVGERAGRLHEVVGPREQAPLDERHLRQLVPDVAERDVYICGPGGFMRSFISAARRAGVPEDRIHYEDFSF
jgi:ferredoxin-NADP reductase